MGTYQDLIQRALYEIGVLEGGALGSGGSVETHLLNEGLKILIEMLDEWSLEGLLSPGTLEHEVTIKSSTSKATLTIGPVDKGTDEDSDSDDVAPDILAPDVPFSISHIQYRSGSGGNCALIAASESTYLDRQDEFDSIDEPFLYWYSPEVPFGKLRLNAKPAVSDKLVITTPKYLIGQNASLSDKGDFLRGYQKAIRLNLAVLMASSTGIKGGKLSAITMREAEKSKRLLKTVNIGRFGQTKFDAGALSNHYKLSYGRYYGRNFNQY